MDNNGGVGLIFDTECDTLSAILKSEYGDYSTIIRKSYHHEPIDLIRRKDDEYRVIERPMLAICLSGTPGQLYTLTPQAEDGTFSRITCYHMPFKAEFRDVLVESVNRNYDNYTLRERFFQLGKLYKQRRESFFRSGSYRIVIPQEYCKEFNEHFRQMNQEVVDDISHDMQSVVRRLAFTVFRIMMVLTSIRFMDEISNPSAMTPKDNSPNGLVNIIFGGDHEVMKLLAFGEQQIDTSAPYADNSSIKLMPAIYEWAKDTYQFCCRMWGEDNIIGFDVHCDETGVHAHALTVPVEQVKKRGRIGSQYVNKDNPDKVLSTKEWKALPKEERGNYIKTESTKGVVERVSYAKVWGETAKDKSQYLSDLHTKYYNEVGKIYGLERGIPYHELSEEEKRERRHKSKVVLEAERQARQAIAEAEKLKAEIETETSIATQQKEEALKDLKTAQSGFLAKIFQPGKFKKEETAKLKRVL